MAELTLPRRRGLWVLVALLALLASLHQLRQLHDALRDAHPTRDNAIYEINVRMVLEGRQWSGPHSQGFRHPGPSFFYLLALAYALAGKTTFSLYAAAQLLTTAFVLGSAVVVSFQPRSLLPALLFVPVLTLEMAYLGDYPLYDFWPPYVLFFGYGLFLLLCATVAAGRVSGIVPLAVTASLLVQTHVSYAPAVLVGLGVTMAHWVRSPRFQTSETARRVAWAAFVTALLWAPPLYAEIAMGAGNFRSLHHVFFETAPRDWLASQLIDRVALEFSGPFQFALFGDRFIVPEAPKHHMAARWMGGAELAALALGFWRARRSRDRFTEALCSVCIASVLAATWSAASIRGVVAPHHTAWISILGFLSPMAAAGAFTPGVGGDSSRKPPLRMMGIVAAWVTSVYLWPIRMIPGVHTNPEVAVLTDAVVDGLREGGKERPLITWQSTAEYDWAVAVMLELEKREVPFAAQEDGALRWMIGAPRWEATGREATVVAFTVDANDEGSRNLTCVEQGANYFMRYPACVWLRGE